ncbi:DinB family protein [Hymenobacter armeniacus]|uniref:DinB family protein n=1 Tax=Hymenobacter armeniacus TaxID=2771358 RepID=A0ABR8K019_9BACT|nr:DinB family protein [Hymenobacter armeniacus]MBD2724561.1 DinB family protein [Hymenobacter armeniacus]
MPAVVRATSDFFDQLTNDLLVLRVVAQQRFRPLSAEELNRRPSPSRWSAGQCLEHLNIVGGYYLPSIAARIAKAQARGSKPAPTVKSGYFGRRFIEAMRTPASVKTYESPQRYAPTGTRLPRTVAEVFSRQIDELLRLVLLARQVNANAIRIPNAIFPLLLFRLTDQLEFMVVHIQRHIAQAEAVLVGNGVPASNVSAA